jgi:hypothetical protein
MNYLQIDPLTGIAIGGIFTKEDNVVESDYVDFRPITGSEGIGWIWNESSGTWSPPSVAVVTLAGVRLIRDSKLLESDWRVSVSDYPSADKDAWVTYRDLLRNFPATYVPTESPEWPIQPTED